MSCKSDYIPVMVPGTNAFGWVPTIFCKPFDKNIAMQEYKESLKAPEDPCDVIFRRCLKGNFISMTSCSIVILQRLWSTWIIVPMRRDPQLSYRSKASVTFESGVTCVMMSGLICLFRLLGLESDIPSMFLAKENFPIRDIWRERVEQTQLPSQLSFEIQSLSNQIDSRCFKKQTHKLVLENIVKILGTISHLWE